MHSELSAPEITGSETPTNGHINGHTNGHRVRVLAADPHPITLSGLQRILRSDPELELVGACGTGKEALEALELCASLRPLVLITDVVLPDMSGVDLWRAIKRSAPDADVLVLTAGDDHASILG